MARQETHVIFGTGPIGMAVMRELVRRGTCVRMVNRSGHADVPAGVEVVIGDAYAVASTTAVCKGADVVYQCAQPVYTQWPEKFPALQAGIVEGAAANGARLVVCDNLYMYGEVSGPITEDLPYAAQTRKGRVRAALSRSLMEAHESGRVRVAIGRGSDYFGPGGIDSAMGERTFRPALAGKTVYALGQPDAPHTYTFTEDFSKALVMLGEHEKAFGQVWHVPNSPTLTTREFLTMIFEEAGHEPNVKAAPGLLLQALALFNPALREMLEMRYEFEQPFVVDSSKFVRAFGDIATPARDAIRQTLDWFRQHPDAKSH